MKLVSIIGARPQFIKLSALSNEVKIHNSLNKSKIDDIIIHTGQHFDPKMSDNIFKQLGIPKPKYNLKIKSLSHGAMTGRMIEKLEFKIKNLSPDHIITYGDTNSTLAAAIASSKLNIPLSHIEAGLRSYNKEMPEEINRVLTDHVSDFLFCPSKLSVKNLKREGIKKNIFLTGDIMYDVFKNNLPQASKLKIAESLDLIKHKYVFVTIHRAINTDNYSKLSEIYKALNEIGKKYQVIFSVHPRTLDKAKKFKLKSISSNIKFLNPLSYLETISMLKDCALVITDSGGLQKEAYYSKRKCLTIRNETEWPETLIGDNNILVDATKSSIIDSFYKSIKNNDATFPRIYGRGDCSKKILKILNNI
jgi:UDP-GlcNAc3NAcA epimerase